MKPNMKRVYKRALYALNMSWADRQAAPWWARIIWATRWFVPRSWWGGK